MRKRPSSIDVAKLAEVSQATVSYVLSNRSDKAISEETRARVLEAADKLGYLPNRLADGILRGKTATIGVLMSDFAHSFNSQLLAGMENTLGDAGYRVLIAHNRNDPEHERRQVRMLMEHRVEGIVAVTDEQTIDAILIWIQEAHRAGVMVCVVDDTKLSGSVDTVVSDDLAGAHQAVSHLIEVGHRRIAYLGAGDRASTSRERRAGYEAALRDHGIPLDPDLIVGHSYRRPEDPDITNLLDQPNPPTAVFAASDGLVAQALANLEPRNVRVPEDLAIVGYGNLEWSRYLGLSTVDQHAYAMGSAAAQRILVRLGGYAGVSVTMRVPGHLIIRRSSKAPAIS